MSSHSPKHALFAQFAIVAKALGHADRLDLLEHLAQGERGVEAVARRVGLSTASASAHLQQLRRAGLVTSRREGKFVLYRLADAATVLDLMASLRRIAENNLAEVDRILSGYFHARDGMEPVSQRELLERARDGSATVLDVRPADEFDVGHLPGAVNIPLAELEDRLGELNQGGQEIVAYCRGAYCVLSFEAVAKLRARGFTVRRLEEGFPEWKAAGLPVESA
ncbi:MAG: ArsR/SmtB family transcription factor [Alphaproteobacteria bacterium]